MGISALELGSLLMRFHLRALGIIRMRGGKLMNFVFFLTFNDRYVNHTAFVNGTLVFCSMKIFH